MAEHYPRPFPPPWAEAWGDDRYGLWAELLVNGVTQRLRWLAPGHFQMGSPDSEPLRGSNEGPQHTVTLTDDWWLADTACTQALWLAVLGGSNPSHFTDDLELPVEQVSWDDVQGFLAALPSGVEAVLPTEAQWEYACRAGSTTPFGFGEQINPHQVNYNDGPKSEYRPKTVPVKARPANAWGLYQMHGNVLEWCADARRDYTEAEVINPSGATGQGVKDFAVRGGGWFGRARGARSARRYRYPRGRRGSYLGFRFALRSTSQPGARGPRPEGA